MILIIAVVSSCEDKKFMTYTANVPVYMSFEELRKPIDISGPADILQPGKIYFKDEYVFINEFMEGVHIIDVSDPSSPEGIVYLQVPGNIDMAIKNNILYLDSYTDLVMIDISNPASPVELNRIEDILEYTLPPWDNDYPLAEIDDEKGVVTGWEIKEYTKEIQTNPYPFPVYWEYDGMRISDASSMGGGGGVPPSGTIYGVGGSMARFLTYDNYLYMLQTTNMLKVVDISNTDAPETVYEKYVGWGLETMFIYDHHMFLGANNGMYILSLEDPEEPYTKSVYSHITSCDPVVVSGDFAYVTLRSGTVCGGTADLLEVIDISDKFNPERIASFSMEEPYGLGISGSTLFVCQGEYGLNIYDASDPNTITSHEIAAFADIHAYDVIPINNSLFTVGEDGFYIYDYADLQTITLIGSIIVDAE